MLIQEKVSIKERDFIRSYSDEGFLIKQKATGILYSEAYDPIGVSREYEEVSEPIHEKTEEEVLLEKATAWDIIQGVLE